MNIYFLFNVQYLVRMLFFFLRVPQWLVIPSFFRAEVLDGRSYLAPAHSVPKTSSLITSKPYWSDSNKSNAIFEIFVFFDKGLHKSCLHLQYIASKYQ